MGVPGVVVEDVAFDTTEGAREDADLAIGGADAEVALPLVVFLGGKKLALCNFSQRTRQLTPLTRQTRHPLGSLARPHRLRVASSQSEVRLRLCALRGPVRVSRALRSFFMR